ncbi:MAG: NADH-quinone oxidoreductase subunit NuoG [Armatimonadetes bacterium]|nr:NADH-quinone oxidoreductase subunit NuoG [Armatimonadota bacterium]
MSDLVTLTIDGQQIQTAPNTLLVEAAAQLGILVPVYCYHPKLAPIGACRMCLVEIEGMPKLTPSCTTPVKEGMVVHTQNARVEKARRGMLEFLLIHHPLDCPVCDKGGECPLQDYTYEFGPRKTRFRYPKRHWDKPLQIGKNILLDRERCIMCLRCVRFCEEISDHQQIGVFERGHSQCIGTVPGHSFDSQFSGNTIELCPVGALTGAPTRFFGRTWEIQHTPSICTGCAAGCNIRIDHRQQRDVVRLWSRENKHTDDGWLCDRGRFGYEFVNQDRLKDFKILQDGQLVDATTQQATVKAASILSKHANSGSLGVLASPILTNEELYAVEWLTRSVLQTSSIDHTASAVNPQAVQLHSVVREAGFRSGVLTDIDEAAQIVTIGVDLSNDQPITELRVKKALFQRKAQLVSLYPETIELGRYTEHNLIYEPGQEASVVASLAAAVRSGGGEGVVGQAARLLSSEAPKAVIVGWKLQGLSDFSALAKALGELASALGPDVPCITIYPNCNTRGALDLGITPGWLPGGVAATGSSESGMTGIQILEAARDGRLKALWVVGAEPLLEADPELVKAALANVEFIYQGWSLRDVPVDPDVVLANVTFAEQAGTFTNTDGRVQRIYPAVKPHGRSRPGWQIVADLGRALGKTWEATSDQEVFEQIRQAVPAYSQIKWSEVGTLGVQSGASAPPAMAGATG